MYYSFKISSSVLFSFFVFVFRLTGCKLAWQLDQDKWDELCTRYAGGLLFSRLIKVTFIMRYIFFVNNPFILVKILIPDPKSDGNFDL